jgi:translation initiation factor IF-1
MEVFRSEDVFFGKVIRNLGGRQILVMTQEGKEAMALIPGALSHRSATPIRSGDIVILLPREYECRLSGKQRFEIFAVVHDRKTIKDHIRSGRVPGWMLEQNTHDDVPAAGECIEFDYGNDAEADDDVDVDEI